MTLRPHAILFDVGGTLLEHTENPQHVALRSVADLGAVDPQTFTATVAEVVASWHAAGGLAEHEDLAETWVGHYRTALERLAFPGDAALAARRMEDGFLTTGWRVYPDVVPTLSELAARGMTMGVISNWPPTLAATLDRAGLGAHFRVVVASGTVGYAKPHGGIFRAAALQLNMEASRILYVGDTPEHDVHGAARAGMMSLLIDRRGRWTDYEDRLTTLDELVHRV